MQSSGRSLNYPKQFTINYERLFLPNWRQSRRNFFYAKIELFYRKHIVSSIFRDRIFIFVDEIDRMLSLDFPVDDFIVTTNELLIQNTTGLPFAIFGVAAPSDLIADREK